MLYVFHVDAGQMTTYDMNLTLQSVANLKLAIERKIKVPANSLVLLVSGGEVLQSDHIVSSYSAGTDTNPIYMFSKPSVKDSRLKQSLVGDLSPIVELSTGAFRSESRSAFEGKSIVDLRSSVEICCSLPATVHTVISCATLAQQFSDLAHEVSRSCDQLVLEQHLQHQGWAAVVANLEDIYSEFCERSKSFKESFRKHRLKKEEYHDMLNTLNDVLKSLKKIPILPALQLHAEAHRFSAFDVFEETDFEGHHYRINQPLDNSSENRAYQDFGVEAFKLSEEDVFNQKNPSTSKEAESSEGVPQSEESDDGILFKTHSYDGKDQPTLLHWILAQGNKASLQDILDYCEKGLALIDAEPLKEREAELYHILEYANMHGLKQIKGIEDRLYGLDQLLSEVKKIERDQHDQAASLIQYRERLNAACDPSVLPTLVQSHCCQLEKLLSGHQVLLDIRRRIANSKDELSHILKARLEAVLMIENSMSVQDAHAMLSFQCFNRLARYFGIVAQLHHAPAVFVRAAHEVARRRAFSTSHLKWATDLAEKLQKIHEEEVNRRQEFNSLFEGHFLKNLFPGMTELPPAYATQAPAVFDARLPNISDEDVHHISDTFPELAKDVPQYDMETTVKFFHQRLTASDHEERDIDIQVDLDKDFESETETGDFEKLSRQSGLSKQKMDMSTTCAPDTLAVSTLTEDNMDTHKINIEKLQEFLSKLCSLCKVNIMYIKEELVKLKVEIDEQKKYMSGKYLEVIKEWDKSNSESAIRFREQTQRLTVDHELEMSDIKASLNDKDELINCLRRENDENKLQYEADLLRLETECQSYKALVEETREQLKEVAKTLEETEAQKQKMHLDFKAEIEVMRSRFRFVALTNMDRSPSESSLEKIERADVIEINSHNAIVMQTKENAEVEKEEAVRVAVEKCRAECEQKISAEVASLKAKFEADKQVTVNEVTRRLLAEKDRQLEAGREREAALVRECGKHRDTIRQLTDPDTDTADTLLKTQLATLENEKAALQTQIADLKKELEKKNDEGDKSREDDSEGSRSSGVREEGARRGRARCHTPCGLAAGALSLSSCLPGHTVLLLWDPAHNNYTVMQEASMMYFVHSDCLPALDLSIHVKNESERRLYTVATVDSKEFCYAKKNGNRYQMPRGSRFYRVRVRPLRPHLPPPPCCDLRHRQDAMKGGVLSMLAENRPLKKWLTYMHAPGLPPLYFILHYTSLNIQKSVDTSQSTSSNTDEACRVGGAGAGGGEVATATLINLESPVADEGEGEGQTEAEDQLDSIEASDQWNSARMHMSTVSAVTDMECSVGRCAGAELELAQEAAP
ncbi:PREDICTED: RB1-inducible coiled-coil protein 1 isoform X1 [Papilio polytes]|uniref:RB1-inducible coiled-coil protein 1 isoform X1 n=1 Tax=Papilio polytes TaxID=76194 RepID=UPI00067615A1|nr:PREDICTED: RB1-inducible coiled-coil protein 1 isoform X1 [Papilio polytes]